MTEVYFIRHAEPDYTVHDDMSRPLTTKGLTDVKAVTRYLRDKAIDAVFSSPYVRAVHTVQDFAEGEGLKINIVEDFRERKITEGWIEDFVSFARKQWSDFDYKLDDGESLREVQVRNIDALHRALKQHQGRNIVIGTHGTALSTIINHYQSTFGFEAFDQIRNRMPWVVRMRFDGTACMDIQTIDL